MKQYEIWRAQLPDPAGVRPVLLLTRDPAYEYLNKFVVAEVTTTVRGIPQEIRLGLPEGLPKACVANCDNLRTVARSWLVKRLGRVGKLRYAEIKRAVGHTFGWAELIDSE